MPLIDAENGVVGRARFDSRCIALSVVASSISLKVPRSGPAQHGPRKFILDSSFLLYNAERRLVSKGLMSGKWFNAAVTGMLLASAMLCATDGGCHGACTAGPVRYLERPGQNKVADHASRKPSFRRKQRSADTTCRGGPHDLGRCSRPPTPSRRLSRRRAWPMPLAGDLRRPSRIRRFGGGRSRTRQLGWRCDARAPRQVGCTSKFPWFRRLMLDGDHLLSTMDVMNSRGVKTVQRQTCRTNARRAMPRTI